MGVDAERSSLVREVRELVCCFRSLTECPYYAELGAVEKNVVIANVAAWIA